MDKKIIIMFMGSLTCIYECVLLAKMIISLLLIYFHDVFSVYIFTLIKFSRDRLANLVDLKGRHVLTCGV